MRGRPIARGAEPSEAEVTFGAKMKAEFQAAHLRARAQRAGWRAGDEALVETLLRDRAKAYEIERAASRLSGKPYRKFTPPKGAAVRRAAVIAANEALSSEKRWAHAARSVESPTVPDVLGTNRRA